jgi:hypothetical protein
MAVLTVQQIALAGIVPSYAAAAGGGDEFANDGRTFLHVKNGGGSPITVTVTTPKKVKGVDIENPAISVSNGSEKMIGPFDPEIFTATDGNVDVAYSGVTSVTVAAVKL